MLRSSNDFATRLIVTFGYFAWNCVVELLDLLRLAAADLLVPDGERHVARLGDVDDFELSRASSAFFALSSSLPPGDAPHPASSAASATQSRDQRGLSTMVHSALL